MSVPASESNPMPRPKGSRNNSAKLSDRAHDALRIASGYVGKQYAEFCSEIVLEVCTQVIKHKHGLWEESLGGEPTDKRETPAERIIITVDFEADAPAES